MTITELSTDARALAKEHWWNSAGAGVICFLLVTFIWTDSRNDYLLYIALLAVGVHAYISARAFDKDRYRQELAVSYKEQLKLQENPTHVHIPSPASRSAVQKPRSASTVHRIPQLAVADSSRGLVALGS